MAPLITATIDIVDDRALLTAPFNAKVAPRARKIGGRWDATSRVWRFNARDIDRVRKITRDVYGVDGTPDQAADLVDVRVPCLRFAREPEIVVAGRTVGRRRERDHDVELVDDVIVVEGGFATSGGSVQNPRIGDNDAVIEVRGVPRAAAVAFGFSVVTVESEAVEQLAAERARLAARIAAIDVEMAGLGQAVS